MARTTAQEQQTMLTITQTDNPYAACIMHAALDCATMAGLTAPVTETELLAIAARYTLDRIDPLDMDNYETEWSNHG